MSGIFFSAKLGHRNGVSSGEEEASVIVPLPRNWSKNVRSVAAESVLTLCCAGRIFLLPEF